MIQTRPNQGERQCGALHFAWLVPAAEATGPLKLWPSQGASVEDDIAAWVEETKAALAEGRVWPYRQKVIHRNGTVERSWVWRDALGRDVRVEPIDLTPIPWQQGHSWMWPETPASYVPKRMAA